jgi:glutamine cyclotransferase
MVLAVTILASCSGDDKVDQAATDVTALGQPGGEPATFAVRVLHRYPHDTEAFTQGLVWADDGELFESTGRRGHSSLRRVEIETGDVKQIHELEPEYFGEGLAQVDDELIQLTWQEETAFIYGASSFEQKGTFEYDTEGWGLCYDGTQLVMSDGSDELTMHDTSTFAIERRVRVTNRGQPLPDLNELECVADRIYANVLADDNIYEIDPATGSVTAVIDASSLYPERNGGAGEVLNGIAFNPETGTFYLTGKNWPTLFEVVFEPSTA